MDMLKRQANLYINSIKNTNFEVYFHADRESQLIRTKMKDEIKEM